MSGRRTIKREHGIVYSIGLGLSFGLLALVVGLGVVSILLPAAVGATPLTVLTQSMEPTYPPGTLVIVTPIAADDIRIGDPITYQIEPGQPELVTHRVVAIAKTTAGGVTFTTQGDNNDAADENPVVTDQITGKVWYSVPWIGFVNSWVGGESRGLLLPIIAVALFGYAGWMFIGGMVSRSRKKARVTSPSDSGE